MAITKEHVSDQEADDESAASVVSWLNLSVEQRNTEVTQAVAAKLITIGLELDTEKGIRANTRRWRERIPAQNRDEYDKFVELKREFFIECAVVDPPDGLVNREIHVDDSFDGNHRMHLELEAEQVWADKQGWRVDSSQPD